MDYLELEDVLSGLKGRKIAVSKQGIICGGVLKDSTCTSDVITLFFEETTTPVDICHRHFGSVKGVDTTPEGSVVIQFECRGSIVADSLGQRQL